MQRRACVYICISAISRLIIWREAIGLPKVMRSLARARDISSMRWHMPRLEAAMWARETDREWMAISMPWPSSPSRYFLSSFMSVNFRPVWAAPRAPIMWGIGVTS